MNPATEATLAELLKYAKDDSKLKEQLIAMVKLLDKIEKHLNPGIGGSSGGGSSGGGSSGGGASGVAGGASRALGALNAVTSLVSGAFSMLGSIVGFATNMIGSLAGSLVSTIGNLITFASTLTSGTARLSGFFAALSDLPLGIGFVFSLFSNLIEYAENLLPKWQELAKQGATFGGSLVDMREAAARSGLTLDSFTKIVRENSEVFATMGGNVQKGVNRFVSASNKLLDPGQPYFQALTSLGYTAEDAASALVKFYAGQGTMNKRALADNDLVAQSVVSYAKELDILTRITGKNREELEKAAAKKNLDEAYNTFIANLTDPKQVEAYDAVLTQAYNISSDYGDRVKSEILGLQIPFGQAQAGLTTFSNGLLDSAATQAVTAIKQGQSLEAVTSGFRRGTYEGLKAVDSSMKSLGTTVTEFQYLSGNQLFKGVFDAQAAFRKYGDLTNAESAAKKQQADQYNKEAARLAQINQQFVTFGAALLSKLLGAFGPMVPALMTFGNFLIKAIDGLVRTAEGPLDRIRVWFEKAIAELMDSYLHEGGWGGMFSKLIKLWFEGMKNIWEVIGPPIIDAMVNAWIVVSPIMLKVLGDMVEYLQPRIEALFQKMLDKINDWLAETFPSLGIEYSKDRTTRTNIEDTPEFKKWLAEQKQGWLGARVLTATGLRDKDPKELMQQYMDSLPGDKRKIIEARAFLDKQDFDHKDTRTLADMLKGKKESWDDDEFGDFDSGAERTRSVANQEKELTGEGGTINKLMRELNKNLENISNNTKKTADKLDSNNLLLNNW